MEGGGTEGTRETWLSRVRAIWRKYINRYSCVEETLLNLPLQEDQASACGDVEREGVLRDEAGRDDILGLVLEVLESEWGRATFLTAGECIKLTHARVGTR